MEHTTTTKKPQPKTQAQKVFDKFGGVPKLHKALKDLGPEHERAISAIYRWNLSKKNGGTNGMVPNSAMQSVLLAAKAEGIVLTPDDLYSASKP
jgi:hypothetical protein